jgi:hypothetical protein
MQTLRGEATYSPKGGIREKPESEGLVLTSVGLEERALPG